MSEEVKKIRRRRKKTPEELKGGKAQTGSHTSAGVPSAARASQAYSGHAQDVQKLKREGLESVLKDQEEKQAGPESGIGTVPQTEMPVKSETVTRTVNGQQNRPEAQESERDLARRSALDSISTFSGAQPQPLKKEKKKVEPEPAQKQKQPQPEDKEALKKAEEEAEYEYDRVTETGEGPYAELRKEYEAKEQAEAAQKTGKGKPEQRPQQSPRQGGGYPANTDAFYYEEEERRKQVRIINIVILILEAIVLVIVLYFLFHYKRLLEERDFGAPGTEVYENYEDYEDYEESGDTEGGEGEEQPASARDSRESEDDGEQATININNDKFALRCTRLQITKDTDGNPAALLFFTFVNKTDISLSMSEVYPPLVVQDGIMCETFASIESPPEEFYNRDTRIQNGEGVDVCYSVKLQNTTSPITLTIHDNYETYEDVAETTIKLQ